MSGRVEDLQGGRAPEGAWTSLLLYTGFTYLLTCNAQAYMSGGLRLSADADDYFVRPALRRFWTFRYPKVAARYLTRWYFWATHTRLAPVIEAAKTLKRHWSGILAFIRSRITNGVVEGLTSKIKTALKRAYGFRTFENYRTIIYLVAGKLELPTLC